MPAELYACVYVREFPAQALLRLRPELGNRPCAVLEGEPPLQSVCAMNARARSQGVAYGMTKVELDTIPAVVALRRSKTEEEAARNALLECAGAFTPRIEVDATDPARASFCCILDITGTEKLLGAPPVLARALQFRLRAMGFVSRIAVSANFHAARCLARGIASQLKTVDRGQESAALATLSLSVLDMSSDHAAIYELWGIRTLGMLAALPEKELIARMGQEGKQHLQMARGEQPHLFIPVEAPFLLEERMELDAPVEALESLLFVIGVMLEQIIQRAVSRVLALATVTLTLTLERAATHTRTVRPALPTNDRQLWIKLLHLDLEAHPPQTAILALTLNADPGCTSKVQLGLFSPQLPEPMRLDVTMARIHAIVGEDNAGCAVLKDTHKPDELTLKPLNIVSSSNTNEILTLTRTLIHASIRQLRPAEDARVTLHDRRPHRFVFRNRDYAVEQAYGPWLTGGDWWNAAEWKVEQWDLIARAQDGSLLSCCLVLDRMMNGWQVAALYD
jgi:protein ImuB